MAASIDLTTALECLIAQCGSQVRSSLHGGLRQFTALLQKHLGLQEQDATQIVKVLEKRHMITWIGHPYLAPCPNILDLHGVWVLRNTTS